MTDAAKRPFPKDHPLRDDRPRLESILDLMWWEILKVLHQPRRKRGKPGQRELALIGGISAEDALQEALFGLLRYEPTADVNWEALGVRIAQNKAKEALRKSRAYRTRTDGTDIEVASLDVENSEGEALVHQVRDQDDRGFTEEQALVAVERLQRQRALHRAASQVLTDRDRAIVARIQRGETQEAIGEDYSLSRVRIGQIYAKALKKLRDNLQENPLFRQRSTDHIEGGNPNDD